MRRRRKFENDDTTIAPTQSALKFNFLFQTKRSFLFVLITLLSISFCFVYFSLNKNDPSQTNVLTDVDQEILSLYLKHDHNEDGFIDYEYFFYLIKH